MKIVFKDSLYDILAKRLNDAKRANKKVDYILVTNEEYAEMRSDRDFYQHFDNPFAMYGGPGDIGAMNQTMRTIDLAVPNSRHGERYRFLSRNKFHGIDLYVVPAEYM